MVYPVSEDSEFLATEVIKYLKKIKDKESIKFLDMGTGSGFIAENAFKSGIKKENILCVDINQEAVNIVKKKGFRTIKSNLFSKIKDEKFDFICFNAPYLPRDKYDNGKDTTGGKQGDETSIKFLNQYKKYLKKNGFVFLLISSLTPFDKIKKFRLRIIAKKKIFFEELIILKR